MEQNNNIKTQLNDIQVFLLKNLAFLPDLPINAKDLFKFLSIDQSLMIDFFDALHDLYPQYLEYKNNYYILPSARAYSIIREFNPSIKDIYKLLDYFVKLYSNPGEQKLKLLKRYEPYVISLLRTVKQKSIILADLYAAYAEYLLVINRLDQSTFMLSQAVSCASEVQPQSPIISEYYLRMAEIYFDRENYEKSFQYVERAMVQLRKSQRSIPQLELRIYLLYGDVFFYQKKFNTSIGYYLKVLELTQNNKFNLTPVLLSRLHAQIAENYRQLQDYDKALNHIQRAQEMLTTVTGKEKEFILEQIRLQRQVIENLRNLHKVLHKLRTYLILVGIGLFIAIAGIIAFLMFFK